MADGLALPASYGAVPGSIYGDVPGTIYDDAGALPGRPQLARAREWAIYTRGPDRKRTGQVDQYESLKAVLRANGVSTWMLQCAPTDAAVDLLVPGAGIIVTLNGRVVLSGPVEEPLHIDDGQTKALVVSGVSDDVHLRDKLAFPDPTVELGGGPYDVRTGSASAVLIGFVRANIGETGIANRRLPGLVVAGDPVVGATVTRGARWENLLQLLQQVASAGGPEVLFSLQQEDVDSTDLVFRVRAATNRTGSWSFSRDLGTLDGYRYARRAPAANHVLIAGGGEGLERVVTQVGDESSQIVWGRRIEVLRDRRDTIDIAEMASSGYEVLTDSAERTTLEATPVDLETVVPLQDWQLGDFVRVAVDGVRYETTIREVAVSLTASGEEIAPTLGPPGSAQAGLVERLLSSVAAVTARTAALEARR